MDCKVKNQIQKNSQEQNEFTLSGWKKSTNSFYMKEGDLQKPNKVKISINIANEIS